jgi:uncharacterized protein
MTQTGVLSEAWPICDGESRVDVTIILAHAGRVTHTNEAIVAAQVCPNIVLEHSWCTSYSVANMVARLGAERVMFGSDHISNIASKLAKVQALGFDAVQLGQVLGGTAQRIFGLERGQP